MTPGAIVAVAAVWCAVSVVVGLVVGRVVRNRDAARLRDEELRR